MTIINTCDQLIAAQEAGLPDVAVVSLMESCGREFYCFGWKVWRPGFNLDRTNTNPWSSTYNCKPFYKREFLGDNRQANTAARQAALDWAAKRYGIKCWKRNRMHDYVDERVFKQFPLMAKERMK